MYFPVRHIQCIACRSFTAFTASNLADESAAVSLSSFLLHVTAIHTHRMSSGQALHPSPTAPRWMPTHPLGFGSFGHVTLATNLEDGSLLAVKSVTGPSPSELLALQNEFHVLQSLQSPFVIRCLGADFSGNSNGAVQPASGYLFLEYMVGGSLADFLRQSGMRMRQEKHVRRFTRSILKGLAYLHEQGIVHCDIKSKNILVGPSGDVKIADFGAARRIGEEPLTPGTHLRGTPLWMAPEVAVGKVPTPASDIWSLGCTVVEMLRGTPPWGECVRSVAAALFKLGCTDEIPPLPVSISSEAEDFLIRCLRRDSTERWTAEQLLKHPFVSDGEELAEKDCYALNRIVGAEAFARLSQPSPRSTLDHAVFSDSEKMSEPSPRSTLDRFIFSNSESEWESNQPFTAGMALATPQRPTIIQEERWIVVRKRDGWSEQRLAPFMQAGAACHVMEKGCRASLAPAEFLISKRKLSRS
ncbi:hypothetical protein KP509_28G020400 [Ceratopteris richardii]|uniref:Protein kinase domain-containing protein n=1 Tax=Ceratopteris richardii TaxID=49495 RepID=A0A8T2RA85_CERRI|nr:hypothetical protein KP509_28G020400 [Ceratopteris richardii]